MSLAGLLLLCFSAAPCDGGSRMVLNEETGAIEIISSPGVQQVGGTPRGKRTEKARKRKDLISAPCGLGHLSGSGSRAYGSADPSLCQTSPTGQRHSPKGVPWISPRVLAGRPKQLDALSNWSNLSNWMHPPRRVLQAWARAPGPRATRSDDTGSPRALMSPRSAGAARFSGGSQPNAHASYFRAFVRAPRRTPSYPPARRATMFACVLLGTHTSSERWGRPAERAWRQPRSNVPLCLPARPPSLSLASLAHISGVRSRDLARLFDLRSQCSTGWVKALQPVPSSWPKASTFCIACSHASAWRPPERSLRPASQSKIWCHILTPLMPACLCDACGGRVA